MTDYTDEQLKVLDMGEAVRRCPKCGSKDMTAFSCYDNLHNGMWKTDLNCCKCGWSFIIFVLPGVMK